MTKHQPNHTPRNPNDAKSFGGSAPEAGATGGPEAPEVPCRISSAIARAMNSTTATTLISTSQYSTRPSQPTSREFTQISTAANPTTQIQPGRSGNQNCM